MFWDFRRAGLSYFVTIPRLWPRTLRWRVFLLVSGLLALLTTTAIVATAARVHVTDVGSRVRDTLRPAEAAVVALRQGYVDMETSERGFQLSRDPQFVPPYESGSAAVTEAQNRLRQLLGGDPESGPLLADVEAAGSAWLTQVAEPAIAMAATGGAIANAPLGVALFDTLRARIAALDNHVNQLIVSGLASSRAATDTANVTTAVCVGLALALGMVTILILRRSLVAPLERLVAQVRQVSSGDLHREVGASGPDELVALGEAVEAMRVRILSESEQVAAAANRIARLEETDRIARTLGDTAIRRLYGITLDLQSAAARFPRSGPVMANAISGIDRTISALRTSVYGPVPSSTPSALRAQVSEVIAELESTHGHTPVLVVTGHLGVPPAEEVVAEVVGVLRDFLHAASAPGGRPDEVELTLTDQAIRLRVVSAVADERAAEVAQALAAVCGDAVVHREPDRVMVEWDRRLRPES